jgi:hypothetical protein
MVLKTTPQPQTATERPISLATRGLIEFKKGAIQRGRELYLQAVEECERINEPRLVAKALLNLAIAEVETRGERVAEFVSHAITATKKFRGPDAILTVRQLRRAIERKGKFLGFFQQRASNQQIRELAALADRTEAKTTRTTKTSPTHGGS